MYKKNRIEERLPLQKGCIIANRSGSMETQTVDMSIMGLGVKIDSTLQFKNGCKLDVFIPSIGRNSLAKLMWIKKDSNNTTRLGLKYILAYY